jgi:hypothetical protein
VLDLREHRSLGIDSLDALYDLLVAELVGEERPAGVGQQGRAVGQRLEQPALEDREIRAGEP